jgi:ribonuclease HII
MSKANYEIETELKELGFRFIVGIDEAGRGPGAGPVVAAAVIIPEEALPDLLGEVNDSKKVSPKKRERLYDEIMSKCIVGLQEVSASVIDEINILEATKLAMARALDKLDMYDYIIVDGTVDLRKMCPVPQQQVIKGDSKSVSIAAASIIAKVYRDRKMLELHKIFPVYGWDKNKGYLTKEHMEAIKTYGITDYHRATFRRVGK